MRVLSAYASLVFCTTLRIAIGDRFAGANRLKITHKCIQHIYLPFILSARWTDVDRDESRDASAGRGRLGRVGFVPPSPEPCGIFTVEKRTEHDRHKMDSAKRSVDVAVAGARLSPTPAPPAGPKNKYEIEQNGAYHVMEITTCD